MTAVAEGTVLVAHAGFFVVSLALIRIDVFQHRLPDAVVLPTAAGLGAAFALAAALAGDTAPLGRAAAGAIALTAVYLGLRAAFPAGLGGGDVKLAAPLGLLLGWHGWLPLVVGGAAAFALGGACAALLLATGRASRDTHIAFGPWMIVGAWAGLLV
jgi:leader peptidase (prepilin peptidase)/N-methyltransferase